MKPLALLFALALLPHPASAESEIESEIESEDESEDESEIEFEYEYETSGSTTVVAAAIPEAPFDALRAVDSLDRDELTRRRPRTVPEALMEVPGAFVQKTNHAGGSPFVRGLTGPHNLILVDGVRVNNSTYRTGPLQYLNTVDSYSLERIELLRGPGSVLYGSDAMGGVIDLSTRDPAPPQDEQEGRFVPLGAVRTAAADWERSGRLGASIATNGFGLIGGITARVFDDLRGGGDIGVQPFTGYSEVDWDAKLRIGESSSHHVDVLYQSVRVRDAGRTDKLETSNVLTMYDQNYRDLVYASGLIHADGMKTDIRITPSYQRQLETRRKILFADELHEETSSVTRNRDEVHTVGCAIRFDTRLLARRLDLVYGVRVYHDIIRSEASAGVDDESLVRTSGAYPSGSFYRTSGLYLLATGVPVRTDNWVELVVYGGGQLSTFTAFAPGLGDTDDVALQNLGAAAAVGVHLRKRGVFNIGLGLNQGFRAPNLNEAALTGSTGEWFHVPNPDLGPERNDTLEFSGRFHAGPVTFTSAAYASLMHDVVTRVPTTLEGLSEYEGMIVVYNTNQGAGRVLGAEGGVQVDLPLYLTVGGDVAYTHGRYEDEDEGWVPMSRIPPLFGTARLRFAPPWQDLFFDVYVQVAGGQDRLSPLDETDARIPTDGTPGWATLNLRAGFRPHRKLAISIGATNLTDAQYKYHGSGVYAPGASVWLALELLEG